MLFGNYPNWHHAAGGVSNDWPENGLRQPAPLGVVEKCTVAEISQYHLRRVEQVVHHEIVVRGASPFPGGGDRVVVVCPLKSGPP